MNSESRRERRSEMLVCAIGVALLCAPIALGDLPAAQRAAIEAAPTSIAKAEALVDSLVQPASERPAGLLPAGTRVDRAELRDGRLEVDLTGPFAAAILTDGAVDEVVEMFAEVLDPAGTANVRLVRGRDSAGEPYRALEEYVEHAPQVEAPDPALFDKPDAAAEAAAASSPAPRERSVSMGIGRQPTGALTGVTVFATGGHGWTGSSSGWGLQRPLLLEMIEDYGNLDQLNYFVQYAFNAGATVVPFRPVGYQNNEAVVDNDDPEVTYTGAWTDSNTTPYYQNHDINGVGFRFATAAAVESATARYEPNIPAAGMYPVYTWALSGSNRTTQTYRVTHTGGTTSVVVDHRMVGKGWVWLGTYHFDAGTNGFVTITNESSVAGVVIADAIRFGNGMGDVVSVAAGSTSGYPRDEECQRYWAESETSKNAVGYPSAVYDCCTLEQDDNVGAAARWAAVMNDTFVIADRFRRIYLEFHSNAGGGRGTLALITGSPTTFQAQYAQILGDEVENDMVALSSSFEFAWAVRNPNTLNGAYGAISTSNNSNEFDATILEIAFHDDASDAALLLDPKVRDAVARSSTQGIVKFLHSLAGSTVPLAFSPDRPRRPQAVSDAAGNVTVSWLAPLSGEAYGDPATGYRIYRSSDGYGFDGGLDVGNALSAVLSDIPAGTATYLRIAAYNAGGESMPTETIAVRHASDETSTFLVVNGFDRVDRSLDARQTLAGVGTQRRPLIDHINSANYTIQQGDALAAAGATFDSCSHQAIIDSTVALGNYPAVSWISGEESSADDTYDATEQTRVTTYLNNGGNLFASGAEIAWDLDHLASGVSFYRNQLHASYVGDDAGTYNVVPVGGSIFAGIPLFTFDNGTLFYDADFPDRIAPFAGGVAALSYSGGTGDTAAVTYSGAYKVVNFGFPFETITDKARRADVMDRIVGFFFNSKFDADRDGDVDLHDLETFTDCLAGPGIAYPANDPCLIDDADGDFDVDLGDFLQFEVQFTGP